MDSVNILSAGHVRYYLELGKEDYYFLGGEKQGTWWGGCAESVGLYGNVQKEQLRAAYRGGIKVGKKFVSLVQRQKKKNSKTHRAGIGHTFGCPKSVSVLWARSERKRRKQIEQLVEKAVHCALKYAENHLVTTRRGHQGEIEESCKLMVALFQHSTNREVEPHLHIHALIMNVCLREDGTKGTIVNDKLFTHKKLLGAIFRAELASLLWREMGFLVERDKEDFFRIANVPESLCTEFSKPRQRIERVMAERGLVGGKAAEMVNLQTRRSKDDVPPLYKLYQQWGQICDQHGFTQKDSLACLGWRPIDEEKQWKVAATEALQRLTYYDNHFTRDQFTCQLAICSQGRGLSVANLHEKVSQILAAEAYQPKREKISVVVDSTHPAANNAANVDEPFLEKPIKDHDIITLGEKNGQQLYTVRKSLQTDLDILDLSARLDEKLGVLMETKAIEKAIEDYKKECDELGYSHSEEKLSVIDEILGSDSRLRLINGKSGAAKTSTVRAIVAGWKSENYKVVGAAPTGEAARILKTETGIKAGTIHSLLGIRPNESKEDGWDQKDREGEYSDNGKVALYNRYSHTKSSEPERMWNEPLDANTVVVVDEASLISSSLMHQLQERVMETGATLLILGDDRQKQSVERAGVFKALLKRFEYSELNEIVRQNDAWAREMVNHASNQEAGQALKSLAKQEAVWVGRDRTATVEAVIEQWKGGYSYYGNRQIVIATRNAEVDAINRKCQLLLQKPIEHPERPTVKIYDKDRGYYGNKEQVWVGDQVVITKNQFVGPQRNKTYVTNGMIGTVTDIRQDGTIQISLPEKDIQVHPASFRNLRLAYAVTSYKAQGNTFDSVLALLGEHTSDLPDFYVQISRFKENIKVFVDEPTLGGKLSSIEASALAKRLESYESEELGIERFLAMVSPLLLAQKRNEQAQENPSKLETKLAAAKEAQEVQSEPNPATAKEESQESLQETVARHQIKQAIQSVADTVEALETLADENSPTNEPEPTPTTAKSEPEISLQETVATKQIEQAIQGVADTAKALEKLASEKTAVKKTQAKKKRKRPAKPQVEQQPIELDIEILAQTDGLYVAQAVVVEQVTLLMTAQALAMSVWQRFCSAGEFISRNVLRPASRLFWTIAFFPSNLWKKFLLAEELRLMPIRLAYWLEKNREKTLLERAGAFLKHLFVKKPDETEVDTYEKSSEEQSFRFFFFLIAQIITLLLSLTYQSKRFVLTAIQKIFKLAVSSAKAITFPPIWIARGVFAATVSAVSSTARTAWRATAAAGRGLGRLAGASAAASRGCMKTTASTLSFTAQAFWRVGAGVVKGLGRLAGVSAAASRECMKATASTLSFTARAFWRVGAGTGSGLLRLVAFTLKVITYPPMIVWRIVKKVVASWKTIVEFFERLLSVVILIATAAGIVAILPWCWSVLITTGQYVVAASIAFVTSVVAVVPWFVTAIILSGVVAFGVLVFVILRTWQGIEDWWQNRPEKVIAEKPREKKKPANTNNEQWARFNASLLTLLVSIGIVLYLPSLSWLGYIFGLLVSMNLLEVIAEASRHSNKIEKSMTKTSEATKKTKDDDEAGEVNLGFLFFLFSLPFVLTYHMLRISIRVVFFLPRYILRKYREYCEREEERRRVEKEQRKIYEERQAREAKERERKRQEWYDSLSPEEQAKVDKQRRKAQDLWHEMRMEQIALDNQRREGCPGGSSGYSGSSSTPFVPVESTPTYYSTPTTTFSSYPDSSVPDYTASTINNAETERARIAVGGGDWEAQNRATSTQIVQGN